MLLRGNIEDAREGACARFTGDIRSVRVIATRASPAMWPTPESREFEEADLRRWRRVIERESPVGGNYGVTSEVVPRGKSGGRVATMGHECGKEPPWLGGNLDFQAKAKSFGQAVSTGTTPRATILQCIASAQGR